jgi:hypothetical protein
LEGLVFNLFEIHRQDLVREFRGLVDFEGGTTIVPGDNVGKVVLFGILDHLVELHGECIRGTGFVSRGTNSLESEDSHGGLVNFELDEKKKKRTDRMPSHFGMILCTSTVQSLLDSS